MKNKRNDKIINFLLVVLVLIGLLLIFNRQIKNFFLDRITNEEYIINLKRDEIIENEKKLVDYNFAKITYVSFSGILESQKNAKDMPVIGGISIPSIDINLPIIKGMSNAGLALGAETMKPDQKMGEKNYALAGHNVNKKGILFSSLYLLKKGEKIYLTDLDYVYEYEVVEKIYVDPSRVEVINDTENKQEVTLVSCNQDSSQRLIVKGDLKSKTKVADADSQVLKYFKLDENKFLADKDLKE